MTTVTGMTRNLEPAGPPQWTPGAGLERLKRETPHIVPEVTADDMRKADEIITAATRMSGGSADEDRRAA